MAFDRKTNSGYGQSLGDHDLRDIFSLTEIHKKSVGFVTSTSPVISPEPEQKQDMLQSLMTGDTRQMSLMETMLPEKSYETGKIDTQGMMRDVNKGVKDGASVSLQSNAAKQDVQSNMNAFQSDWRQAKSEALNKLTESAEAMGISPKDAVDTLMPSDTSGNGAALAYIGGELLTGGGSLATMGKGLYVGTELSKEEKKLSPEKQEALLKETLARLQNPSPAASQEAGASDAPMAVQLLKGLDAPKSAVSWENMKVDDLAEFLKADQDGLDQPEMIALAQLESDLKLVDANHANVAAHYGDTVTNDKLELASTSPHSDFTITLAGDDMRGLSLFASNENLSSETVAQISEDMKQLASVTPAPRLESGMRMGA